jgi:hypothetical protein
MNDVVKRKRRKPRVPKNETPGRMDFFLKRFAMHGFFSIAAQEAGLATSTVYRHVRCNPDLQRRFLEAEEMACVVLRDEILRRAVRGVVKPVFNRGRKCGEVREYSDKLLIHLLQARCPEFRSNCQLVVSADADVTLPNITVNLIDSYNSPSS